jgi:hypothetical protein
MNILFLFLSFISSAISLNWKHTQGLSENFSVQTNTVTSISSTLLRFDGFYRTIERNDVLNWLRFFKDGTVINVSTKSGTPDQIAKWFNKSYEDNGTYKIKGSIIEFSCVSKNGQVDYRGAIKKNSLKLQWYSHINGHKGTGTYSFIKVNLTE